MNGFSFLAAILASLTLSTGCGTGKEAADRVAEYQNTENTAKIRTDDVNAEKGTEYTVSALEAFSTETESKGPAGEAKETAPSPEESPAPETESPETGAGTDPAPEPSQEAAPAQEAAPVPEASEIVLVKTYIPDIEVDLKYATDDNFTGKTIYDFSDAYLRYGTILKLEAAQEKAREHGMVLLIWDAFRPVSAQFRLWEVYPDSTYVANPNTGFSSHSRGNTVDVSMVAMDGREIEMPTGFDDFSTLADRDYSDCTKEAAGNARLLEQIMTEAGFQPYFGEWWHFSDTEKYPVESEMNP